MADYVKTPSTTPAGYQGPEYGPFKCAHCEYYTDKDKNQGTCSKPQLAKELGTNIVEAEGCCNFYESTGEEMPLSNYFGGGGQKVMDNMKKQYGGKKAKQVFYATANKRKQKQIDTAPMSKK